MNISSKNYDFHRFSTFLLTKINRIAIIRRYVVLSKIFIKYWVHAKGFLKGSVPNIHEHTGSGQIVLDRIKYQGPFGMDQMSLQTFWTEPNGPANIKDIFCCGPNVFMDRCLMDLLDRTKYQVEDIQQEKKSHSTPREPFCVIKCLQIHCDS